MNSQRKHCSGYLQLLSTPYLFGIISPKTFCSDRTAHQRVISIPALLITEVSTGPSWGNQILSLGNISLSGNTQGWKMVGSGLYEDNSVTIKSVNFYL